MLVPRTILSNISKAAASENSRYALNSVQFGRTPNNEPYAVATDGKQLIVSTWSEPDASEYPTGNLSADLSPKEGFETLISASKCAAAAKANKPGRRDKPIFSNVFLDEHSPQMIVSTPDQTTAIDAPATDGRFPRWQDVFPAYVTDPASAISVCVNADLLISVLSTLKGMSCDDYKAGVTLTLSSDPKTASKSAFAVSARGTNGTNSFAVMMPLSADKDTGAQPEWNPLELMRGKDKPEVQPEETVEPTIEPAAAETPIDSVDQETAVEPETVDSVETAYATVEVNHADVLNQIIESMAA